MSFLVLRCVITDNRLNASIAFYKGLLGIRNVAAVAENELHLEYDIPNSTPITLKLGFDEVTKALNAAEVRYTIVDLQEQATDFRSKGSTSILRNLSTSPWRTMMLLD